MTVTFNDIKQAVLNGDPVALCTSHVLSRNGLAKLPIPGREVWMVSHPGVVHEILLNKDGYGKGGDILDAVAADLGKTGLFNIDDQPLWRVLRRLVNSEFHVSQVEPAAEMAAAIWDSQMSLWTLDRPITLHDEFMRLNLHYLMEKMFGQSASSEDIAHLVQLAGPVFADMFKRIAYMLFAPPLAKRLTKSRDALDAKVRAIIARADSSRGDLLGRFKLAQAENPRVITDRVIRDQVFTLLMAGFDSTATVTSWAAIALASNSSLLGRVRCEILDTIGTKVPTHEDILQLKELSAFLQGVLRVHPAFPLFFRMARTTQRLGNQVINQGATLVINLDALHRSAPQTLSIPFGEGARKCPAERLAQVTMAMPLVRLLQRYSRWQNVGNPHAARFTMTRWPKDRAAMLLG